MAKKSKKTAHHGGDMHSAIEIHDNVIIKKGPAPKDQKTNPNDFIIGKFVFKGANSFKNTPEYIHTYNSIMTSPRKDGIYTFKTKLSAKK